METEYMKMNRMSKYKTTRVMIATSHTIAYIRVPLENGCPVLTRNQVKKYGDLVSANWGGHEIMLELGNDQ